MTARGAPSVQAMLIWLQSDRVVLADGGVLSWSNPDHPGYRYPEAAALLLSLLTREGAALALRDRLAHALALDVSPAGGLGKGGREYVFDAAMALSAFLAHAGATARSPDRALSDPLFEFIAANLAERRGMVPGPSGETDCAGEPNSPSGEARWSHSYGCHLLKSVLAISAYCGTESARGRRLARELVRDLLPLFDGQRFRTHAVSRLTYLHAHCYAVEGLLGLRALGAQWGDEEAVRGAIRSAARWLAGIQRPEGGLPAWHDGSDGSGGCHADVAAQAVRIWTAVDRRGFTGPIGRALRFLGGLQAPAGGIWYSPESADVNTWATIFAAQAVRWAGEGATGAVI